MSRPEKLMTTILVRVRYETRQNEIIIRYVLKSIGFIKKHVIFSVCSLHRFFFTFHAPIQQPPKRNKNCKTSSSPMLLFEVPSQVLFNLALAHPVDASIFPIWRQGLFEDKNTGSKSWEGSAGCVIWTALSNTRGFYRQTWFEEDNCFKI